MPAWDSNSLWLKARVYADRANTFDQTTAEFALLSALALELLARAALTKVHPALNADQRNEQNLLHAFGIETTPEPRSLPVHAVFLRLQKIIPAFAKPQRDFCDYFTILRNREVHTGDLPFDGLNPAKWLPKYYEVTKVLCEFLEKSLEDLVGDEVAEPAYRLIVAASEEKQGAVLKKINHHRGEWESREDAERQRLAEEVAAATKFLPSRSTVCVCPACGSMGVLRGNLLRESPPIYEDGVLYVNQDYVADQFKCGACGLQLVSIDEIGAAGLFLRFRQTRTTELHELFQPEHWDDYENM